jgi:general secretion pathway protein M
MIAERWRTLPARDRRALAWLGGALALALAWFAVWQPLQAARARAGNQLEQATRDRDWIRERSAEIGRLRAQGALLPLARGGKSLLALADAGAREAGLGGALKRVEPVSQGRVNLWFESVPFDALTDWLEQLEQRYGVRVDELGAERAAGVGMANVRVGLVDTGGTP